MKLVLWLVTALGAFAESSPNAKTVIERATKALGAEHLRTLRYAGSGFDFALGQAPTPKSPWPRFIEKRYERWIEFEAPASRMERTRLEGENPPRGGGGGGVFGGGIIFGEQKGDQVISAGSEQAKSLPGELMMMLPYGFLRAASFATDTRVKGRSIVGKASTVISFTAPNRALVTGYFNDRDFLERIETKIDNNVLGDIPFETFFSDYKDFSGLQFPTHIIQNQAGYPVFELSVNEVEHNVPVRIGNPSAAQPASPRPAPERLGDGAYLILGGYAAIAIDFKDYIVILEGPQNDQRSTDIISEAKKLIPNKAIKFVVNTHAHFDHSGGLRAFVAEGTTIVTHQMNQPYYARIWDNPHTLNPNILSQHPRKPSFKTVTEKLVLTDGNRSVELYHLLNFAHNDAMIIAYLPKEKILFEADGFNPPAAPITSTPEVINPYTASLVDNIDRLKLKVERVIPVHYPPGNRNVTMNELRTAVGEQKP